MLGKPFIRTHKLKGSYKKLFIYIFVMSRSEVSTMDADLQAYQAQRNLFLDAQAKFKAGDIGQGILCCGYLHSMFGILPIKKYPRDKSKAFIDKIDILRRDITIYTKTKRIPKTGNYLEYSDYEERLGNKLDELFLDFVEIMNTTEFNL